MCLAQGPQRSDAGEARTRYPSVSSHALYHWATALPLEILFSDTEFSSPRAGIEPIAQEASAKTTELPRSHSYQHMLSG